MTLKLGGGVRRKFVEKQENILQTLKPKLKDEKVSRKLYNTLVVHKCLSNKSQSMSFKKVRKKLKS